MIETLWLMCTGTTTAYVPNSGTALRCAQNQCKHIWVLGVVTLAAYSGDGDNMVRKHHQLMMNMLLIPDHQSLLNLMIQTS